MTRVFRELTATLLLMVIGTGLLQAQTISGTVTDEQGNPMPYATVCLSGNKQATTTDMDGHYTLQDVGKGPHHMLVAFVSFESQQRDFEVTGDMTLDFKLKEVATTMNEVVVLPEGESMSYYVLNQVLKNRHPLKYYVNNYTGTSSCRIQTCMDMSILPSGLVKMLNFMMALGGYKKIMVCMEKHPDLNITMEKSVAYNEGKINATATRIAHYQPSTLTQEERDAFAKKGWELDKNCFNDIYDQVADLKKACDKQLKKTGKTKNEVLKYEGSYTEDGHIIHIIKNSNYEVHVVNGLWQVRRIIYQKKSDEKQYYECAEMTKNVFMPISAYIELSLDLSDKMGDLNAQYEKAKAKDISSLSQKEQKAYKKKLAQLEKLVKNHRWTLACSNSYSYKNIVKK